ncbi:MAG: membrane-bound O-acyltransferase family protein [Saprospirales bacterium]|nr:membrane-bound O-acyltransferase family protein [Saprospirales bacterium]
MYWFVLSKSHRRQNIFILVASYLFYGLWDYRFLSLIALSTTIDYFVGLRLAKSNDKKHRKFLLSISLIGNLSILGFFKYYNFFVESLAYSFGTMGIRISDFTMDIILPVGISFYTLQTLSYTIDIYRDKIKPTEDFIAFSAFVSFFPQLVAGPIERASNLLPQFLQPREFNYKYAVKGMEMILWGLFMKVVIADSLDATQAYIFFTSKNPTLLSQLVNLPLSTTWLYCDFAGYSLIARGTARLLGFELMRNFAFPFFATSVSDFWKRWHISLTSWLMDYVFRPYLKITSSKNKAVYGLFLVFILCGLWHGARLTFLLWGGLTAIFYIIDRFVQKSIGKHFKPQHWITSIALSVMLWFSTQAFFMLSGYLFRSPSLERMAVLLKSMTNVGTISTIDWKINTIPLIAVFFFFGFEYLHRKRNFGFDLSQNIPRVARWGLYLLISFMIVSYLGQTINFVYFQF